MSPDQSSLQAKLTSFRTDIDAILIAPTIESQVAPTTLADDTVLDILFSGIAKEGLEPTHAQGEICVESLLFVVQMVINKVISTLGSVVAILGDVPSEMVLRDFLVLKGTVQDALSLVVLEGVMVDHSRTSSSKGFVISGIEVGEKGFGQDLNFFFLMVLFTNLIFEEHDIVPSSPISGAGMKKLKVGIAFRETVNLGLEPLEILLMSKQRIILSDQINFKIMEERVVRVMRIF
ncbi:hypothetical protein H5410_041543 [Solanum commersonii]|uniref:Uncharacterized protein n=1 Tax=Solanum commersonii TaxID=4109 RepID=A0A9J5XT83_SOLCO|nr:hypothetical protein H5410_041543 [Solanum commersonii]